MKMSEIIIRPAKDPREGWTLSTCVWIPQPIQSVFDFFANAGNLEMLTPPWLHFRILTPQPIEMSDGTIIDYRLKLRLIPIRWRSEISNWHPPVCFVDRQLRGPYREWVHTHSFETNQGGTIVRDDVQYSTPGGRLVHDLFVGPELKRIFKYRHEVLLDKLGCREGLSTQQAITES